MGGRRQRLRTGQPGIFFAVGLCLSMVLPGFAQSPVGAGLGTTAYSWMGTLLEKTFLRIDVMTVDICFDARTAERLAAIAGDRRLDGAAADSLVHAVLDGRNAAARIEFVRDFGLDRFLEGIIEDQRRAVVAGLISDTLHQTIRKGLPEWFAFLETRGVRDGDQIGYEMGPGAIRTIYANADGTVLLDQMDDGRDWRNSVLATWLAPGASLRSGLLRSLEREDARMGGVIEAEHCAIR